MTTLHKCIYLKAEPKEVWAWLTEPEKLAEWFHKPKAPLAAGKRLELFGTTSGDLLIWGEVRAAKPYEYLEYTFEIKHMQGADSVVKWTLDKVPGGTRLTMEHSGLADTGPQFDVAVMLDEGWEEHMARMRKGLHLVPA